MYTVLRPLPYGVTTLPTGTLVDGTGYRWLTKLIAQRYLRPATPEEIEAASAPGPKPAQKGTSSNAK